MACFILSPSASGDTSRAPVGSLLIWCLERTWPVRGSKPYSVRPPSRYEDLPAAAYPATISGSLAKTNGVMSATLGVTAQIGEGTIDMSATLAPGAITATATATNLTLTTLTGQAAGDSGTTSSSIVLVNGTVTASTQSRSASMAGTFDIGGSTLTASGSYTSSTNWSILIAANSATGSGQTVGYRGASLDSLSGTVTMRVGWLTTSLTISGVAIGDVTVDQVRPLAEKYYGAIPAREVPARIEWRPPVGSLSIAETDIELAPHLVPADNTELAPAERHEAEIIRARACVRELHTREDEPHGVNVLIFWG